VLELSIFTLLSHSEWDTPRGVRLYPYSPSTRMKRVLTTQNLKNLEHTWEKPQLPARNLRLWWQSICATGILAVMFSHRNDVQDTCLFVDAVNDTIFGVQSPWPITGILVLQRFRFPLANKRSLCHFLQQGNNFLCCPAVRMTPEFKIFIGTLGELNFKHDRQLWGVLSGSECWRIQSRPA